MTNQEREEIIQLIRRLWAHQRKLDPITIQDIGRTLIGEALTGEEVSQLMQKAGSAPVAEATVYDWADPPAERVALRTTLFNLNSCVNNLIHSVPKRSEETNAIILGLFRLAEQVGAALK